MRIALVQFQAEAGNVAANLAAIDRAARDAKAVGAALLIAPELAVTGYGVGDAITALAEPRDGRQVAALRESARKNGIAILVGFAERDGDTVYNSAVFVDGDETRVYRKAFLYGDYEKRLFTPAGPQGCIVECGGLKVGVLICYDVEFPENVRRLAEADADLVAVPTALPASDHDAFISGSVIPVRAFENQVHVAYANHCGADGNFAYAGLSRIAAPDGATLAVAGAALPELLIADIEPTAYARAREANPYLEDLRQSALRRSG
jgi:predicted amidohydrolase